MTSFKRSPLAMTTIKLSLPSCFIQTSGESASICSFLGDNPAPRLRDRHHGATKYALWDAGKRLEPPRYGRGKPCSKLMRCVCGEVFAMYEPAESVKHVPHLSAGQASRNKAAGASRGGL